MGSKAARAALAAILLAFASPGVSHQPPPDAGCRAPARPADDQDDVQWQRFLDDVDSFRACVSDYVDANQAASAAHAEAARAATLEWNAFVRSDLNVPEDFPWPPEQDGGG